jgi:hypothetical protein
MSQPTILERAFELARTGNNSTVSELREALQAEGFDPKRLQGPSLQKQLRQVCADAKRAPRGSSNLDRSKTANPYTPGGRRITDSDLSGLRSSLVRCFAALATRSSSPKSGLSTLKFCLFSFGEK